MASYPSAGRPSQCGKPRERPIPCRLTNTLALSATTAKRRRSLRPPRTSTPTHRRRRPGGQRPAGQAQVAGAPAGWKLQEVTDPDRAAGADVPQPVGDAEHPGLAGRLRQPLQDLGVDAVRQRRRAIPSPRSSTTTTPRTTAHRSARSWQTARYRRRRRPRCRPRPTAPCTRPPSSSSRPRNGTPGTGSTARCCRNSNSRGSSKRTWATSNRRTARPSSSSPAPCR
jgi:hypothetical protein